MSKTIRRVAATTVLLAFVAVANSEGVSQDKADLQQPPAPPVMPPSKEQKPNQQPVAVDVATPAVAMPEPPSPELAQPDATVDQLLDQLEAIRKQKLELQRREETCVLAIKARLARQNQRLRGLGVETPGALTPAAPAPGQSF